VFICKKIYFPLRKSGGEGIIVYVIAEKEGEIRGENAGVAAAGSLRAASSVGCPAENLLPRDEKAQKCRKIAKNPRVYS